MSTVRAVQVSAAGGRLETVERSLPEPGPGQVRIAVAACGICHSDALTLAGGWHGLQVAYPRVPGHEVVGRIDALGPGVSGWTRGTRVGVGWHGGACGACDPCRRGDGFTCQNGAGVTGIHYDGGYAEAMIAPAAALARVPDGLTDAEAAPLMCAGVTTFNALRNSGARPGDRVAVLGIGGLGHLGVQFSARMGFETVAIARGKDKEPLARELGASAYIDSQAGDPAAALTAMGGARVVLATVTNGDAMSAVLPGLGVNGTLMVLGAAGPMQVDPSTLISGRRGIQGWYSGTAIDSQDTLAFCVARGVRSMNETYPLGRAQEAYARMESGAARFRVVLTMNG